jgi:hypothetical protein
METALLLACVVLGACIGRQRVNRIVRRRTGRREVAREIARIESRIGRVS